MSKFKYLGKDNTLVGRFGRLKQGQVVDLWETESEYVLSHPTNPPTWAMVKQELDDEGVGEIVPKITKHFDLTRVFWLREAYAFLSRQSRSELLAISRAFREIGAKVLSEADCQTMSREALKEMIYSEVKRLRWTDHVAAPVMSMPEDTENDEVEPATAIVDEEESTDDVEDDDQSDEQEQPAAPERERGRPIKKNQGGDDMPKTYRAIRREK